VLISGALLMGEALQASSLNNFVDVLSIDNFVIDGSLECLRSTWAQEIHQVDTARHGTECLPSLCQPDNFLRYGSP
jgi:hypothetical protein